MVITAFRYSMLYPFGTGVYKLYESGIDLSMYHPIVQAFILEKHTHNQFTNALVEFGYLGFGILISIYNKAYRAFRKIKNTKLRNIRVSRNRYIICNYYSIYSYALFHNGGILHAEPTFGLSFAKFYKLILIKNKNLAVEKRKVKCLKILFIAPRFSYKSIPCYQKTN
jgi:O-antigen ligase